MITTEAADRVAHKLVLALVLDSEAEMKAAVDTMRETIGENPADLLKLTAALAALGAALLQHHERHALPDDPRASAGYL